MLSQLRHHRFRALAVLPEFPAVDSATLLVTEYCVFCGKPIPESDSPKFLPFVRHLYCSTSCAHRQQLAIKRLRESTPPEPVPVCQSP